MSRDGNSETQTGQEQYLTGRNRLTVAEENLAHSIVETDTRAITLGTCGAFHSSLAQRTFLVLFHIFLTKMPPKVEVTTAIAAPPAVVYEALMDFASYPSWNPMVISLSGTPTVGSQLEAQIKVGSRAPMTFKPTVVAHTPQKEFRWVGMLFAAWIYRGEHYFIVEEAEEGTRFIHGENFSGVLEPILNGMMGDDLPKAFEAFNLALKERVEGGK